MLDAVSLIHMNGRVYDPTLGRFLSADLVIQSLGVTQSINPYSYAWNDPLSFTDPSGHSLLGEIIGLIVTIVIAYFAPELLGEAEGYLFGGSFGGLANAVIAGFVGGFVGGVIATGNLSASLTAGLIGGITAGLFNEVGTLAAGNGTPGSEWGVGTRVLAHAAVGCVSGQLSSGNCGRGALAAAVSEAANSQGFIVKYPSLGVWSALPEAAEAGLIGGAASRIEGGKFVEGFSVAAAGYLFNSLGDHSGLKKGTVAGAAVGTATAVVCDVSTVGICLIADPVLIGGGAVVGAVSGEIADATESLVEGVTNYIHGNSLLSPTPTTVYELLDVGTGDVLKYGITSAGDPDTRYSTSYYDKNNAVMNVIGVYDTRAFARAVELTLCVSYVTVNGHLPPMSQRC